MWKLLWACVYNQTSVGIRTDFVETLDWSTSALTCLLGVSLWVTCVGPEIGETVVLLPVCWAWKARPGLLLLLLLILSPSSPPSSSSSSPCSFPGCCFSNDQVLCGCAWATCTGGCTAGSKKFRGTTDKVHQEPRERRNERVECSHPSRAMQVSDLKQVYVGGEETAVHP